MDKTTSREFWQRYEHNMRNGMTRGQSAWWALNDSDPAMADELSGSLVDPYYHDERTAEWIQCAGVQYTDVLDDLIQMGRPDDGALL